MIEAINAAYSAIWLINGWLKIVMLLVFGCAVPVSLRLRLASSTCIITAGALGLLSALEVAFAWQSFSADKWGQYAAIVDFSSPAVIAITILPIALLFAAPFTAGLGIAQSASIMRGWRCCLSGILLSLASAVAVGTSAWVLMMVGD